MHGLQSNVLVRPTVYAHHNDSEAYMADLGGEHLDDLPEPGCRNSRSCQVVYAHAISEARALLVVVLYGHLRMFARRT